MGFKVVPVCSCHQSKAPLPKEVCCDPESGTDHSLKEVSVCLIWNRVYTGVSRVRGDVKIASGI